MTTYNHNDNSQFNTGNSWSFGTLKLCRQCLLHDCWFFTQPWEFQWIVFSFHSRHFHRRAHSPGQDNQEVEENRQDSEEERGLLVQAVDRRIGGLAEEVWQRFHHDSHPDDQDQGPDQEEVQGFREEELSFGWCHLRERNHQLDLDSHHWAHGDLGERLF